MMTTYSYVNDYGKVKVDATNPNKITPKLQKGLILDLPLQEPYTEASGNLVSNGDFSLWTNDDPDGWVVDKEGSPNPEISEVGSNEGHGGTETGACNLYSTGDSIYLTQTILELGKTYVLDFDLTKRVSGALKITSRETIAKNLTTEQHYSYIFTAGDSTLSFGKYGTIDTTIDNVVVKELNGTVKDRTPNQNNGTVSGATLKHDGLVNSSDGIAYIPSETAYGSWEFNFRLGSGGNHYISFIDTNNTGSSGFTGYYLLFNSSNRIYLAKANAGGSIEYMFNTADNYVALDTDYKLKITRSLAGDFAIYIKGGEYGWDDWILVDDSITGELDYTISSYFNTEFRAGDKISNLKINGKKRSLAKATQSTGTWTTTAPSYDFDGVNDYIDVDSTEYTPTSDITISGWFKTTSTGADEVIYSTSNVNSYLSDIGIDEGKFVYDRSGDGSDNIETVNSFNDGDYHQFVITTGNNKIYIDNVEQTTQAASMYRASDKATIGARHLTGVYSRFFNGQISGLKVWNRALSASEIDYLYNREKVNYK